jgi:hypothetical protein
MPKIKCPVCGGNIIYHRIDDGENKIRIISDEAYVEIGTKSHGSTSVYCETDATHDITGQLRDTVIEIAQEFGY